MSDLPKVVLHDHLIGGLRASTLIELADAAGYRRLPTADPERLERWMQSSGTVTLARLLWMVDHAVAVTQTRDALATMAREAVEDLEDDGVVYAEVRMAPGPNSAGDLTRVDVVDAVLKGIEGATTAGGTEVRLVLTALRGATDSEEIAEIAVAYRDRGVVGFDIAGMESERALLDHGAAIRTALDGGVGVTLHAGEESAPETISEALDAGAQRIGVAYTLRDDMTEHADGTVTLGPVASRLLATQTPVELCPSSDAMLHKVNAAHHHFEPLHHAGLNVSLNTDNRLISGSTMTGEFELASRFHGLTLEDLRQVTLRSIDAAFCDDATKKSVRSLVDGATSRWNSPNS